MSKYDVLCVGSATVDTFLTIEQPFSSIKIGDKVLATSIEKHSGGGATNSAAALSKLGFKVKMLTKLGNDHDADFILQDLRKYHADNLCRARSVKKTDSATIISSAKEHDRVIFVYKGASMDLGLSDIRESQITSQWIYLASLTGKSFQAALRLAKIAQKKNINLLFNPSLYLAGKGTKYLKDVLENTAILVLNLEEAQALAGTSSKNIPFLLRALQKPGPKVVVITSGNKGLSALHKKTMYMLPKTPAVKIADTTGAGDAFTAGFLAGIMKRYSIEDALRLGQVNATSVIQYIGAKEKLLTEKEAKQMMKKYKITVLKKRI